MIVIDFCMRVQAIYDVACYHIERADKAEFRVKAIESAWQDAELRAEKAEARVRELEAES